MVHFLSLLQKCDHKKSKECLLLAKTQIERPLNECKGHSVGWKIPTLDLPEGDKIAENTL